MIDKSLEYEIEYEDGPITKDKAGALTINRVMHLSLIRFLRNISVTHDKRK